jgi:thermitase
MHNKFFFYLYPIIIILSLISCNQAAATKAAKKTTSNLAFEKNKSNNEILVKFKMEVTEQEINQINKSLNAEEFKKLSKSNIYQIKFPVKFAIDDIIKKYSELPQVEYVQPNYKYETY